MAMTAEARSGSVLGGLRLIASVFKLRIGVAIMLSALAGLAVSDSTSLPAWKIAVLALAVLMSAASAGALNQYVERESDARMPRTRNRPFVTGRLKAGPFWLGVILSTLGMAVLMAGLALNWAVAFHVFMGAFIYGVVYTIWLKHRTWLNIVVGGLAGSFAVLAGAAAVGADLSPSPLILAIVLFFWTPPHFWSLAMAVRDQYAAASVPMLPVVVGDARAARVILGTYIGRGRRVLAAGVLRHGIDLSRLRGGRRRAVHREEHQAAAGSLEAVRHGQLSCLADPALPAAVRRHCGPAAAGVMMSMRAAASGAFAGGSGVIALLGHVAPARPPMCLRIKPTALARSDAAIGRQLEGYRFAGIEGPIALADLRGKPVVLNLVYTGCADICPMIVQNLDRAIDAGQEALGAESFAVLTIGFDSVHDTPERMAAFARTMAHPPATGDLRASSPRRSNGSSDEVGFTFYASPKGFDHLAQTTILDGEGRIYSQVLGADFSTPAMVEPLKDLVFGRQRPVTSVAGVT